MHQRKKDTRANFKNGLGIKRQNPEAIKEKNQHFPAGEKTKHKNVYKIKKKKLPEKYLQHILETKS